MSVNILTIQDVRLFLAKELKNIYQEPEISSLANIIIKTVFKVTKLHQLHLKDIEISSRQSARIVDICKELKSGKPIQYILGETEFYDCIIRLNSSTLIPRQETEELVDLIIKENRHFQGKIIDLGTGSGCIAIALARNLRGAEVVGTDISDEALRIAGGNALFNRVPVSFLKEDIFNPDPEKTGKAGIIVSNPPYVLTSEKKHMNRNVLDFEPPLALFVPDSDPLVFYRAILRLAEKILLQNGYLYLEINEMMGNKMVQLLESSGYSKIDVVKDINGKARIVKGTKNG
jgi:release factor glutamine methyltransferase